MTFRNSAIPTFLCLVMALAIPGLHLLCVAFPLAQGQSQVASQPAIAKQIGSIKAINGNAITLAPNSGPEISITVDPKARILRLAPGDKDLKAATPVSLQELQVGDMIRVRGQASADGKSISALEVIVISKSVVAAVSDQIRQDWQKRGMGGLVKSVDPTTGTVTISVMSFSGAKTVVVHTSKSTIVRRYAPDSVKFDDAKASSLTEIQPGDQLRARGDRNPEGTELTAEEIVTGSFRNVAGTVNSIDASASTISVQDLLTKKAVTVKVTPDSQLHKIPAEMAQRIAIRLKGALPAGVPGTGGSPAPAAGPGNTSQPGGSSPQRGAGGNGAGIAAVGMRSGGAPDFQQILSRMPAQPLDDLHKGDAVMMVTTQGTTTAGGTVITLVSGVEPILQAAPSASQAMMLAPWTLGGPPGGDLGQ